jgi:hypothetical protein
MGSLRNHKALQSVEHPYECGSWFIILSEMEKHVRLAYFCDYVKYRQFIE